MVQDVVKERQVDVLCREIGVRKLAEHGLDACNALGPSSLRDVVDESLVHLHGIDPAAGSHGACERQTEYSRAGTDVRQDVSGLEPEPGDDFIDAELLDSFWSTQGFDPPLGGSKPQLPSDGFGRADGADDSCKCCHTGPFMPQTDLHLFIPFVRLDGTVSFRLTPIKLTGFQTRP